MKEWVRAKGETDRLIAEIADELKAELAKEDIGTVALEITFDYSNKDFNVAWSYKNAAFAAGLDIFGASHMLITKTGCAGRF